MVGVLTDSEFEPRRPHKLRNEAMLLSWIAISKIEPEAYRSIDFNDLIKISRNPGFLKPLGITSERAYRPWVISPHIEVWQEIERRINRELNGSARGRSSVLKIVEAGDENERTVSFAIRFYRPNIIAVEIHLKTELNISLEEAFSLRDLKAHPATYAAVDSLIGIIKSGSIKGYSRNNSFFSRPAIVIPVDVVADEFGTWRESNKEIVANLLINNAIYDFADSELAQKIFARNKDVDIKFSRGAFSLISKQGVLSAYASKHSGVLKTYLQKEHFKRVRYLEFALALREFVSEFLVTRQQNEDVADFLLFLGQPFIGESVSIPKSVTGTYVWQILSKELKFNTVIESLDKHILDEVDKKVEHFLALKQSDYDSLDFAEKLNVAMRGYRRNWFERAYARHKAVFWIIGALITISGIVIGLSND